MSCKGCLHEEVCSNGNCRCKDYTPIEEWVHLPCKIGDELYVPVAFRVVPYLITSFKKNDNGDFFVCRNTATKCKQDFHFEELGQSAFLTFDEAQKIIDERKQK